MRRTSGRSRRAMLADLLTAIPVSAALTLMAARRGAGADKKKNESFAVIAGTVFRPPGFALQGAEVAIEASGEGKPPKGFKPSKVRTNSRGEFAFRVPAGEKEYLVTVTAKDFKSQEKTVQIYSEERADLYFLLDPEQAN